MQYEISLPADYDMQIIRQRVATKGHLMDDFPGLGLKAFLIRERGVHASPVNQYAPFYLWRTAEGMAAFLRSPGFAGLAADFGRPPVQHWLGVGFRPGPARDLTPRTATRRTEPLPADADPAQAVSRALAELPDGPGLHSAAVALDPRRWELLRFALWEHGAPDDETRYEVLHLSHPELTALGQG
ncbi:uncharacterized protein DUF4865 [Kitasatospora atroaurantiaca]|uniref:Uncharacterized protein DUF4865 n=2 Tax=Kitasatospora atroaurantiaca TaxID=285545 RepID=A0A561EYF8_9ACTN|nr:uncharacterized protein DUF4865 [Kitasatospora atroaurantiaca]